MTFFDWIESLEGYRPCRPCGSTGFILNLVGLLRKSKFVDNKFSVECPGRWNRI